MTGRRGRPCRRPGGSAAAIPTRRPTHPGAHPNVRALARTLAAGPVGGVRPGEEPGVLLGSYGVGLGRDCAGPSLAFGDPLQRSDAGDEAVFAGLVVTNRGSPFTRRRSGFA